MQHRGTMECVDKLLRKITSIDKPFGRKMLLAVGGFRQTAPVVPGAGKSDTVTRSIRSIRLWPVFHILRLHAPINNAEGTQRAEFVDAAEDGKLGFDGHSVPLHMIREIYSTESTIQYLYPPVVLADSGSIRSSFLSLLNQWIDSYSRTILDVLPGEGCTHAVKRSLVLLLTLVPPYSTALARLKNITAIPTIQLPRWSTPCNAISPVYLLTNFD